MPLRGWVKILMYVLGERIVGQKDSAVPVLLGKMYMQESCPDTGCPNRISGLGIDFPGLDSRPRLIPAVALPSRFVAWLTSCPATRCAKAR